MLSSPKNKVANKIQQNQSLALKKNPPLLLTTLFHQKMSSIVAVYWVHFQKSSKSKPKMDEHLLKLLENLRWLEQVPTYSLNGDLMVIFNITMPGGKNNKIIWTWNKSEFCLLQYVQQKVSVCCMLCIQNDMICWAFGSRYLGVTGSHNCHQETREWDAEEVVLVLQWWCVLTYIVDQSFRKPTCIFSWWNVTVTKPHEG